MCRHDTHTHTHTHRRNPALFNGGQDIDCYRLAREYLELAQLYKTDDCFVKNHLFKLLSTVAGGWVGGASAYTHARTHAHTHTHTHTQFQRRA